MGKGARLKKILPVFGLLAVLGTLEVASGWWLQNHGNTFDRAREIVWADPDFGWRQRPNLHREFEGAPFATNSFGLRAPEAAQISPSKIRVLVLGPASALGWGVPAEQTYAAEISRLLGGEAVSLNAGEIGFTTFQGLKLLRSPEVAAFHPTHVVVAYGVNDLDRHRIYFDSPEPDSKALVKPRSQKAIDSYRLYARSSLLTLLIRMVNGAAEGEPTVRVPANEFAENLSAFAAEARRMGAKVAFLGTPVNLPVYTPQLPEIEQKLAARFSLAVELYRKGETTPARLLFEELAKLRPQWNEPYYYLAAIARANGQTIARAYEDRALLSEPYRVHRDVLVYNAILKTAAQKSGATFVDLYAELANEEKAPLFVDALHPSALGHARIARAVVRDFFKTGEAGRHR
jgi:lysophospholipase L1-like esterase